MYNTVIHIRLCSRVSYIMFIKFKKKVLSERRALLCCCAVGQNKQFQLRPAGRVIVIKHIGFPPSGSRETSAFYAQMIPLPQADEVKGHESQKSAFILLYHVILFYHNR